MIDYRYLQSWILYSDIKEHIDICHRIWDDGIFIRNDWITNKMLPQIISAIKHQNDFNEKMEQLYTVEYTGTFQDAIGEVLREYLPWDDMEHTDNQFFVYMRHNKVKIHYLNWIRERKLKRIE